MPAAARLRIAIPVLLAGLAAAAPASAGPGASASRACSPPPYPGSGYFNSLSVTRTTCAKGRRVALAHHECRTENGRKGRCSRRVLRFRCSETRFNSIPTEYSSRVRCTRGDRRVVFVYQQNT